MDRNFNDILNFGNQNVYIIAIGGIGMSAIAKFLLYFGYNVSGSDIAESKYTSELQKLGIKVFIGHSAENISNFSDHVEGLKNICTSQSICKPTCIISSIIKNDNPELVEAKKIEMNILHRSDILSIISKISKNRISISGSHGKTTTTSMAINVFESTIINEDFIGVNGGIIENYGTNIVLRSILRNNKSGEFQSNFDYFISEADESDNSFNRTEYDSCIVTNISSEHIEYYGSFDELKRCFSNFIQNSKNYSVVCSDDLEVRNIISSISSFKKGIFIYGLSDISNDIKEFLLQNNLHLYFQVKNIKPCKDSEENSDKTLQDTNLLEEGTIFDISVYERKGDNYIEIENISKIFTRTYGIHNALNATGVFVLSRLYSISEENFRIGLKNFSGTKRRFSILSKSSENIFGITIVDDYAHHPKEIEAVIKSAIDRYVVKDIKHSKKKVISVVQPHKYSRLNNNFDYFVKALNQSDICIVLPVYAASEQKMTLDSKDLYENLNCKLKFYCEDFRECENMMLNLIKSKEVTNEDVLLFLGAGDITNLAHEFSEYIKSVKI
jgi:UDP-N-acetylmuramate--alanine ligase